MRIPAQRQFYFHGLPGSSAELRLFDNAIAEQIEVLHPLDFDRFQNTEAAHGPYRIIGFSLGAFSALRLAATKPERVKELILISPAAPLEIGNFLPDMAGAPVFRTAQSSALALAGLTSIQSVATALAPQWLIKQLLAETCETEQALLKDPAFVSVLIDGLKSSFGPKAGLYRKAVRSYVRPWANDLQQIHCPCKIIHGDKDTWAPVEMAKALSDALPGQTELLIKNDLGHYSTLIRTLPSIIAQEQ